MRDRAIRLIPMGLAILVLAGCGPTLTKPQQLAYDAYDVCRGQGPSTRLEGVTGDGRWSLVGREGEVQRVNTCMGKYTRQVLQPPPAQRETPVVRAAAELPRVPGTWKGTLRLPARSGESAPPSTATLRLSKDGTAVRWQLVGNHSGAEVSAAGVALVSGDRLRLTGTFKPPSGRAAANDPPRVIDVVYMGTFAGEALDATGLTADQQVHVLSMRRVD